MHSIYVIYATDRFSSSWLTTNLSAEEVERRIETAYHTNQPFVRLEPDKNAYLNLNLVARLEYSSDPVPTAPKSPVI